MSNPKVSIVIGTYNRRKFLMLAIASVRKEIASYLFPTEIIVIDGGSTDGTLKWLTKQKDIITIVQHNRGEWCGRPLERRSWGYFMNLGFKCAGGKFVCMLSDDCLVVPGAIRNGVELFEEKLAEGEKVGAVAFFWRNWPEQLTYRVGLTLGNKMFVNHGLYLTEALQRAGYCDEERYIFYHADGDLCLKMWEQGYSCIDSPDSYVEHYSHANLALRSFNLGTQQDDWSNYLKRWDGVFYHQEKRDIGDWVEKEFRDPDLTANRFKYPNIIKWYGKKLAFTISTLFQRPVRTKG